MDCHSGVDQAILARSVEVALSWMSGRTTLSSPVFFSSFWFFMHFIKRECFFDFLWPIEIENSFLTESQMFPYQLSQTSCVLIKNMRIVCNWSVVLSHFTAYHDHVTWIILKLYLSRETESYQFSEKAIYKVYLSPCQYLDRRGVFVIIWPIEWCGLSLL